MSEPVIAQKGPYALELDAGEYWYCTCGKSSSQPFCDGSHKDTNFSPLQVNITEKGTYYFCGCKRTAGLPYCDGTHNDL